MRIAIPVRQGRFAVDFRDCKQFEIVDTENWEIKRRQLLTAPLIQPWMLPHWLQKHDVDVIIAESMNERVVGLFEKAGIKVVTGASCPLPDEVVREYLTDRFVTK